MSTNRIRPGTSAIELLRALATPKPRGASADSYGLAVSTQTSRPTPDPVVLRRRLKDVVQDVDLDSEEQQRAARRPVLQEILLWEFGETFRQHGEFAAMLDSIEHTFDADPAMPRKFVALLRELKK